MEGVNFSSNKKHGNSGEFPKQDMELTYCMILPSKRFVMLFEQTWGLNNKRDLTNPKWTGIASQHWESENIWKNRLAWPTQVSSGQLNHFKSVLDGSSSNHLQTVFGCPEFSFGGDRSLRLNLSPSPLVVGCWTSPLSGYGVHGRGTRVEQAKASGHRASCCGSKMLSFQWYKVLGSKVLELSKVLARQDVPAAWTFRVELMMKINIWSHLNGNSHSGWSQVT